jgi:hypothetical protein
MPPRGWDASTMGAHVRSRTVTDRLTDLLGDLEPGERRDLLVRLLPDLLDATQVADKLGLSGPTGVSSYRAAKKGDGSPRHPDFPAPVLPATPTKGQCFYWWAADIDAFLAANPGLGRKARDAGTPPS